MTLTQARMMGRALLTLRHEIGRLKAIVNNAESIATSRKNAVREQAEVIDLLREFLLTGRGFEKMKQAVKDLEKTHESKGRNAVQDEGPEGPEVL